MKKTSILVLLTLFFVFSSLALAADSNQVEPNIPQKINAPNEPNLPNTKQKTNEPNLPNDVNKNETMQIPYPENAQQQQGQELTQDWTAIDQQAKNEMRQWSRPGIHQSVLKEAQKTSVEELMLIRKLAVQENANQTISAIDKILAMRNKRYDEVLARIEEQKQKDRTQRQRPERTDRRRQSPEERRRLYEERMQQRRQRPTRNSTETPEY